MIILWKEQWFISLRFCRTIFKKENSLIIVVFTSEKSILCLIYSTSSCLAGRTCPLPHFFPPALKLMEHITGFLKIASKSVHFFVSVLLSFPPSNVPIFSPQLVSPRRENELRPEGLSPHLSAGCPQCYQGWAAEALGPWTWDHVPACRGQRGLCRPG